ncbi:hypothetical protein H8356DRAFT_1750214 [Neocallimastix lanati (nom. inval.)]|jgi:hypothetical protein|nr:hypothetical protein H8356DRAFT_1750209 [Neocallimastix sp. JGI-2020a]KAG4083228.1 hypothetical protein H8356DRAFT_1750214 [Neocallimastix sp. JGI-2020a]
MNKVKKIFLKLILIFCFYYNVSGEYFYNSNLTMEDVKKLKVIKPHNESCYLGIKNDIVIDNEKFSYCVYNSMCPKKGNCVFMDFSSPLDYFYMIMNRPTTLYTQPICRFKDTVPPPTEDYRKRANATYECKNFGACSKPGYEIGYCSTTPCHHNRECFSNNCVNSICMVNVDNPIYNCRTYDDDNGESKVKCFLHREERCFSDEECDVGEKCYGNICGNINYPEKINSNNSSDKSFLVFILLNLIIFVILCIFCCTFCWMMFHQKKSIL